MPKLKDLSGMKFGRLTVLSRTTDYIEPSGRKRVVWLCKCDCGNYISTQGSSLKSGSTKSCGCIKAERNKKYFTTHGCSKEKLYRLWKDIKKRCYNHNYKQFKDYGGRGIKVCDKWLNDYLEFRIWALNNGYNPNAKFGDCTIDRINVNGNYSPDNCRFVSMKVQNNNKRRNLNV